MDILLYYKASFRGLNVEKLISLLKIFFIIKYIYSI